jgi:predicted ester cyclase
MADARANIRRWFEEIWNRRNLDVVDEYMDAKTVIYDAGPRPGPITRAAEFKAMARELYEAFPDLKLEVDDVIAEGPRAALRFTATGTHLGPWLGNAPTKRSFTVTGMAHGEWNGDTLVRGWNNIDLLSLLAQLDLITRP